ncbi:hypothetical protein [Candidatus Korobacter versatilis]|uniref:hypothetical protein n=1 Tax=Candidatus Korobacter versatilis TaxID=658062 RepID=UPI0002F457BC|nr:hypothetical protein [Candidatus Koribacter versatilis]
MTHWLPDFDDQLGIETVRTAGLFISEDGERVRIECSECARYRRVLRRLLKKNRYQATAIAVLAALVALGGFHWLAEVVQ